MAENQNKGMLNVKWTYLELQLLATVGYAARGECAVDMEG